MIGGGYLAIPPAPGGRHKYFHRPQKHGCQTFTNRISSCFRHLAWFSALPLIDTFGAHGANSRKTNTNIRTHAHIQRTRRRWAGRFSFAYTQTNWLGRGLAHKKPAYVLLLDEYINCVCALDWVLRMRRLRVHLIMVHPGMHMAFSVRRVRPKSGGPFKHNLFPKTTTYIQITPFSLILFMDCAWWWVIAPCYAHATPSVVCVCVFVCQSVHDGRIKLAKRTPRNMAHIYMCMLTAEHIMTPRHATAHRDFIGMLAFIIRMDDVCV